MERLSLGPPPAFRWLAWQLVGSIIRPKTKGLYERLLRQKEENKWAKTIDNDVDRTFPFHEFFRNSDSGERGSGQKPLRNVLLAYATLDQDVGYCQSMNFVAAFILMVSGSREKESFYFFCSLLTKSVNNSDCAEMCGVSGFFASGFRALLLQIKVFHRLFKKFLPKLQKHLENIPDALYLNKWFLTLFLYSFPLGLCIRIWDNILADGTKFIIKVALSILKLSEGDLLKLDFNGINEYFKSFSDRSESGAAACPLTDFEMVIREAHKFQITDLLVRQEAKLI